MGKTPIYLNRKKLSHNMNCQRIEHGWITYEYLMKKMEPESMKFKPSL